ncbi:MAG: 4-(cytidine 5'-diphospho)-2-C-methyl-D-erythritol kinase [Acidobacteria bacterium]|nr:4-(cytidine 5'-diphospho)-2-C-methyl-D-erythritol kinase [Acidobacteriota bacterium]
MAARRVDIDCHAKLNLGLRVERLRADGYHEIRSVLQTITLHDTLVAEESDRVTLEIQCEWAAGPGGDVPSGSSNLVLKAAAQLEKPLGGRGAAMRLTKRIPPGTGLGAASADAAATLLALDRLHGLTLDPTALHRAAAAVGSDVPFFLYGGACLALGRGEEVYPLPDGPKLFLVVIFSRSGLGTPEVYRRWDGLLTSTEKVSRVNDFAPWCLVIRGRQPVVVNDLEPAALDLEPRLGEVRSALLERGASAVSMTGSGSAFFGIFGSGNEAEKAALSLRRAGRAAVTAESLGRQDWERAIWRGAR